MKCKNSVVITLASITLCFLIYILLQNAFIKDPTPEFENSNGKIESVIFEIPNIIESPNSKLIEISQPIIFPSEYDDTFKDEIITSPSAYEYEQPDLLQQILQPDEAIKNRFSDLERERWNKLLDEVMPQILQPTSNDKPQPVDKEQPPPILDQLLKSSIPVKETQPNVSPIKQVPPIPVQIPRSSIPRKETHPDTFQVTKVPGRVDALDNPSSSIPIPKPSIRDDALNTPTTILSSTPSTTEPLDIRRSTETTVAPVSIPQTIANEISNANESYENELPLSEDSPSGLPIASSSTNRSTFKCCNSSLTNPYRKNILFLKLHKTAGGTVQNILMRFGLHNELYFILPTIFNYIPSHYGFTEYQLPMESKPANGKYNILTHYMRYTPDLKNFMYPDTVTVTILRSPASVFESMYNHYLLNLQFGDLDAFLRSPPALNATDNGYIPDLHGYNQMSADLGLDKIFFANENAIRSFIQFVDNEFDFVMIAEHFDESLVLLAHLMGWSLNDVAYLPMNKRNYQYKYTLMEPDREKLNNLNRADSKLYDHFLKKFYACRIQFGVHRLEEEVTKLRKINDQLREKCVLFERVLPVSGIIGYDLKNFGDWECIYATKYEKFFTDELKLRQIQRVFLEKTARW